MAANVNTSVNKKLKIKESDIQKQLIQWSQLVTIPGTVLRVREYLFANANGGYRNPWEGRSLKEQGVTPGVFDLVFAYPSQGFHGLWLELKIPGGVVSQYQKAFGEKMKRVGYCAEIVYGFDDAIKTIMTYLKEPHVLHTHKANQEKSTHLKKNRRASSNIPREETRHSFIS